MRREGGGVCLIYEAEKWAGGWVAEFLGTPRAPLNAPAWCDALTGGPSKGTTENWRPTALDTSTRPPLVQQRRSATSALTDVN